MGLHGYYAYERTREAVADLCIFSVVNYNVVKKKKKDVTTDVELRYCSHAGSLEYSATGRGPWAWAQAGQIHRTGYRGICRGHLCCAGAPGRPGITLHVLQPLPLLRAWAELGTTYPHRKQPESKSGQGHRVSGTKLLSCWEGTSSRGPHFLESTTGCLATGKSQARWKWLFAPKKTAGWINRQPPCHLHLSQSLSLFLSPSVRTLSATQNTPKIPYHLYQMPIHHLRTQLCAHVVRHFPSWTLGDFSGLFFLEKCASWKDDL